MDSITIDGTTQLVGVIGWPIAHSLSPTMHNAAFRELHLNWSYVPMPVRPGESSRRSETTRMLPSIRSTPIPFNRATPRALAGLRRGFSCAP